MEQFRNPYHSHEHSSYVLDLLYGYDDFLESVTTVADLGCGGGLDINWWATLTNKEDPFEPYNFDCYAVDIDTNRLVVDLPENVTVIKGDFETALLPKPVDVLWCHDAFQYAINPLSTLKLWNQQMNVNGMMILTIPQQINYHHNRLVHRTMNGCYYNYTYGNLMYMLAINGFDCRDAYFYKRRENPWIYAAVYKNSENFLDPRTTNWQHLADQGLINDNCIASVNSYGYLRQEDIVHAWLDKDYYSVED